MYQTFIIITCQGLSQDIDTIISGHDAATHAYKHREMLRREFGFTSSELKVFLCESEDETVQAVAADFLEERILEGKPVGRKAMRAVAEKTGAGVYLATFQQTVIVRKS